MDAIKPRSWYPVLIGEDNGSLQAQKTPVMMGMEQSPICPGCGEEEETSFHFLGEGEALGRLKHRVFGAMVLKTEDGLRWPDILTFIRRSKRFEE